MLAAADGDRIGEDAGRGRHVLTDELDDPCHPVGVERLALLNEDQQLVEDGPDEGRVGLRPRDPQLVPAGNDPRQGEGLLDLAQEHVALAEQIHHEVVARNAKPYLS